MQVASILFSSIVHVLMLSDCYTHVAVYLSCLEIYVLYISMSVTLGIPLETELAQIVQRHCG